MSDSLVPVDQTTLPADPADLARFLRGRLEALVLAERAERGQVTVAEDVFPAVRSVARAAERLTDYGRVFTQIGKEARQYIHDDLVDAVGEQDGIPISGLTVPDGGDVIKIGRDTVNTFTADVDAITTAATLLVLSETGRHAVNRAVEMVDGMRAELDELDPDEQYSQYAAAELRWLAGLESSLVAFASEVVARVLRTGKFEPQRTKVDALVAELSGAFLDDEAASVRTTTRKTTTYRGVTVKREQAK